MSARLSTTRFVDVRPASSRLAAGPRGADPGLARILRSHAERTARKREPMVFTSPCRRPRGKFVPTMVRGNTHTPSAAVLVTTAVFRPSRSRGCANSIPPEWAHQRGFLPWRRTPWWRATNYAARSGIGAVVLFVRQGKEQLATEGVEGAGTVRRPSPGYMATSQAVPRTSPDFSGSTRP